MQIYLPIAELSSNILLLLVIGGAVGFVSGLFGVGGGFLLTPILMFLGIPPAVAVASQATQVVAASVSGVLVHWNRGNVDFKMGLVLLVGGLTGSTSGVFLFSLLRAVGQVDLVIALAYFITLGGVGGAMMFESVRALLRRRRRPGALRKLHQHTWVHGLPFKMRFRKSRLYISALLPGGVGFVVGMMAAIMGVSGSFVLVPAMIYLLGMPTAVVVGTSLFQAIFVAANVTFLQAVQNQTVDVLLAFLLLVGGVVGAQFGGRASGRLPADIMRILLAAIILTVAVALGYTLVVKPDDLYSLAIVAANGKTP